MTSTLSRKDRYWVKEYLSLRDGRKCAACGKTGEAGHPLDIDHKDGNPTNNSRGNLRLLCRSCNVGSAIRRAQDLGISLEREGDVGIGRGLAGADSTSVLKSRVNYSSGSPEMQVNDAVETEFRGWTIALLIRMGEYPLNDLISDGAEHTGVSVNAVRNYLRKMCSPLFGPLETFRFAGRGPTHVRIKPHVKEALDSEKRTPSDVAQGLQGDSP